MLKFVNQEVIDWGGGIKLLLLSFLGYIASLKYFPEIFPKLFKISILLHITVEVMLTLMVCL